MTTPASMTDVANRITAASYLTGQFTLRSGIVSDHYFDKYAFESDPKLLSDICTLLAPRVPEKTDVLVGMELGGVPIATMLSQLTGLPLALARKETKNYGTARQIEGLDVANKNTLIVEDIITSGGAVADSIDVLRTLGANVQYAICVINRGPEEPPLLGERSVKLDALFTEGALNLPE
jgi:orotate phosphoribosyltransferase